MVEVVFDVHIPGIERRRLSGAGLKMKARKDAPAKMTPRRTHLR
jgi:hypothetical protein